MTPVAPGFPYKFNPFRRKLYTPQELFSRFKSTRAGSFIATYDFQVYREYVTKGGSAPTDYFVAMMQALHDQAITQALLADLGKSAHTVGVMGGHSLDRDSEAYRNVVKLSRLIAGKGFTIITGGGPGAMEAAHLGARLANSPDNEVNRAISQLKSRPRMPKLGDMVKRRPKSKKVHVDKGLADKAQAWFAPAFDLADVLPPGAKSIGIPTWYYGHEPTTPFATFSAKYFQNSIREDGLLNLATCGVIFVRGEAGTLQEVFQDNVHNFYAGRDKDCRPIVFLDSDYWRSKLPAPSLLATLYRNAKRKSRYNQFVKISDDHSEILEFLLSRGRRATVSEVIRRVGFR